MIDRLTYLFEHAGSSSEEWQHIRYLYGYFAIDYDRQFQLGLYITLYCSCFAVIYILILDYLRDFFDKGGLDMFKKISVLLSICLVILISVPSVPVFAAEGDSSGVRFYTTESVDGFFTGSIGSTSEEDIASYIYTVPNSFVTSDIVNALNNFPSDPNNGNSSPLTSGYWFVCVNSSLNNMTVFWPLERFNNVSIDWSSGSPLLTANSTGDISFNACFSTAPATTCYMMQSSYNFNTHTWGSPVGYTMSSLTDKDNIFNFRVTNLYGNSVNHLLSCSDSLKYLYSEIQYQYETQLVQNSYLDFITSVYTSKYNYVNFLPATLPYYDGSEIITPDGGDNEETNANHMYFQRCNFGFAEPSNVNQFSSFGGAYFYIDYGVDNWVRDHISDYQIKFHAEASVGSSNYSFTKRFEIDPDNYITVPFSLFDGWSNPGFSAFVTNRRIDNTFLKSYLYSVAPSNYQNFYDAVSTGSFSDSVSNALQSLINSGGTGSDGVLVYSSNSITKVLTQSVLTNEFINSVFYHNNFKFRVSAILIDKDGNESGVVSREFDIVRGSDTATDNSGLTNEDPFESDDDSGDLPIIPHSGDGSLVTSSGTGVVNNINIPNEYSISYRDGVNSFIDWFDKDPEVTGIQNSFWGAMGVFKGNPANELYSDYFGFLPDGFKSIIFGCAGVGIIGGAATILRKRLMK